MKNITIYRIFGDASENGSQKFSGAVIILSDRLHFLNYYCYITLIKWTDYSYIIINFSLIDGKI